MEASPCRFASERHWTEEKERALIAFFSKHSCLWNHKSENYKNRQLRWKTLEHLRILLSSQPPPAPFTVEDIKNKFKNLRTTFQRQSKLVRASKASSSDPFVPQWKHYQQLMFLQDCWDQDHVLEEPPLADPPEENKPTLTPTGLISFLPSLSTSSTMAAASCVPSNILVKSYWTEDRECALISFYAEHSCLWSKKSENHNNRQLRQKLLESLRSRLSDHLVSFSVDDIKCKFKNLRTVFNREHKSMQASRVLDKPYVSRWKHYHHLLFLCESGDEDESPDDLQVLMMNEAKDLENGTPASSSSSTLSSFSSSSSQTNNNTLVLSRSSQSESQTRASAGYQILLPTAPDHLKPSSQSVVSTLPASPSRPLPDRNSNGSPSLLTASCLVRPDVRLTPDSRCLWSEAKVQQLISFYSEHSCLWNHRMDSYRNRVLRQSLLERLSGLLSEHEPVPFSVEDIKTKFRNLRTIFQREHKAVSSNRTCGSEDFYLPKWKHYHDLMFLCDSCDEDERPEESGLLRFDSPSPSLLYSSTNQTAPNLTITRMSLEAPPSPTPSDSQLRSPSMSSSSTPSPSTPSSHVDSRASGHKRAGAQLCASTSEPMKNRTESPHAGFLKYVEECLNETPPDKVKKLKKTIIELIHSVAD